MVRAAWPPRRYHHNVCAPACCAALDLIDVEFVDRGEAGGSRVMRLRVTPGTGEQTGMHIRNAHEELKEFQASGAASARAGAGSYL